MPLKTIEGYFQSTSEGHGGQNLLTNNDNDVMDRLLRVSEKCFNELERLGLWKRIHSVKGDTSAHRIRI